MSVKHRAVFAVATAAVTALLSFVVAGRTSTHSSVVSSLATSTPVSSAVDQAKSQLNVCLQKTGTTALLSSSGRSDFIEHGDRDRDVLTQGLSAGRPREPPGAI